MVERIDSMVESFVTNDCARVNESEVMYTRVRSSYVSSNDNKRQDSCLWTFLFWETVEKVSGKFENQ